MSTEVKTNIGGAMSTPRTNATKVCRGQTMNKTKRQIKHNMDTNLNFLIIIWLPTILNEMRAI